MTVPDAAAAVAAAGAAAGAAAHPVLIGAFFAALGAASYQEVRWRSALNALTLAMAAMAAAHLAAAYGAGGDMGQLAPPAMLAGVAAAMLGLLRLAGLYGTADWAILSSLFAVLIPAGLHLAVLSVLAAVSSSCVHVVAVCAVSNSRCRIGRRGRGGPGGGNAGGGAAAGVGGGWLGAAAAFVSSKRRSARDRWAYAPRPAPAGGGSAAADGQCDDRGGGSRGGIPAAWRGPRGGPLLGPGSRYAGRISPSVPVLAHSCAASAALLAVVGP